MNSRFQIRGNVAGFAIPVLAILTYGVISNLDAGGPRSPSGLRFLVFAIVLPVLLLTVMTAVNKASRIAKVIGEPYGTLVLTISITIIEVALILSIMLDENGNSSLARDTVFAVIMIVCNGLVGLCILVGGIKHHEQDFEVKGANAYLAVISALAVLVLILPNYTQSTAGPILTQSQLLFVSIVTALLYAVFVYTQTVRHTEHFTEVDQGPVAGGFKLPDEKGLLLKDVALLLLSLSAVVLLSKTFTTMVQTGLSRAGALPAAAGFIVAGLILLPEAISALRAAQANQLQRSINLSLGSSLATIGLTVPAVALLSLWLQRDLVLGLPGESSVLLLLTLLVSAFTFGTGRTNILYGFIHLIIFATSIFLIFVP